MATKKNVEKTPALTSDKTRQWYIKNGYKADEIPELAKDSVPKMFAHIDAQKKRRGGPITEPQAKYLLDNGWTRDQVRTMTFGEASTLIYKSKKARGLLKEKAQKSA